MADGRKNNGGHKTAGRKPKAKEMELVDALKPYDDLAREKLINGVKSGEFNFIKLFYEYRYGKPRQIIDVTTTGESLNKLPDLSKLTFEQLKELSKSNI